MSVRIRFFFYALAIASPLWAADEIHYTFSGRDSATGQDSIAFDGRGTGTNAENPIRYGTSPGNYANTLTAVAPSPLPFSSSGPFREAKLTGLSPNTLYYYSIGNGPEHTFRTPPFSGGSDFIVAAEADVGTTTSYFRVGPVQNLPSSNDWSESTVTWNTAPAYDSSARIASLGQVNIDTWYEVDVTSLITGEGTYSLRIPSTSSDGANYASKENASFAPQLVITTQLPASGHQPKARLRPGFNGSSS